jgi:hypothetical protein
VREGVEGWGGDAEGRGGRDRGWEVVSEALASGDSHGVELCTHLNARMYALRSVEVAATRLSCRSPNRRSALLFDVVH